MSDREKKDLKTEILIRGYSEYETDYFNSDDYNKLRTTMLEYLPKMEAKYLNFKLLPKSLMLQSGKYIVDKHFGKIDLRVPYTNGDELKSQIVAIFGCNPKPEEYDSIIDYIKNQLELVKVTDIPVFLNTNEMKNGYTGTTWFYGNNIMEEDYYRKLPVCVKEISIEGNCDEESQCIYVHEMMHALSDIREVLKIY